MKERPILFSDPMVTAILEGRKTVTRRVVKHLEPGCRYQGLERDGQHLFTKGPAYGKVRCPYGQPGDRLWVREAWARIHVYQAGAEWVVYRACDNRTDYGGPWKPSIHMFRRDSRCLLDITDVRVERLQDITEEQAAAEGVPPSSLSPSRLPEFRELWRSTGGDWDANPWVWVIEFKQVVQPCLG